MATLNPLQPLQSTILEILAIQQGVKIADIHKELTSKYKLDASLQNLYKAVGKMLDVQMLMKNNGKLYLNSVWLSHATHFVETANQTYSTAYNSNLPLAEGERAEFFANSLGGLDPIWNHSLIQLAETDKSKEWYTYNAHPWYSLGMRETESRLYQSIASQGIQCHMLYGNNNFLDIYGKNILSVEGFTTSIASESAFPKEGHALWLCGDHILECIFPEIISRNFSFFFQSVQSIQEFDPQLFADIFKMKARCKITIRRSKKEATGLRKKLKSYL